jgi:hypothetical protein
MKRNEINECEYGGLPERQYVWYILHEFHRTRDGVPFGLGLVRIQMVIQTAHFSAGLRRWKTRSILPRFHFHILGYLYGRRVSQGTINDTHTAEWSTLSESGATDTFCRSTLSSESSSHSGSSIRSKSLCEYCGRPRWMVLATMTNVGIVASSRSVPLP